MRLLIFEHVFAISELRVPFQKDAVRACIRSEIVRLVHFGVPVLLVPLPGPVLCCHSELNAVVRDLMAWHVLLHLPCAGEVIDLVVALELAIFPVSEVIYGILASLVVLVMLLAYRLEPTWRDLLTHAQEQRIALWRLPLCSSQRNRGQTLVLLRQILVVYQRHLARIRVPVSTSTNINSIIFESHAVLRLNDLGEIVARAEYSRVDAGVATWILVQLGVVEQLGLPSLLTRDDNLLIQFAEVHQVVGSRIRIVEAIQLIEVLMRQFGELCRAVLLGHSAVATLPEVLRGRILRRDDLLATLTSSLSLCLCLARSELVPHWNLQSCISRLLWRGRIAIHDLLVRGSRRLLRPRLLFLSL